MASYANKSVLQYRKYKVQLRNEILIMRFRWLRPILQNLDVHVCIFACLQLTYETVVFA